MRNRLDFPCCSLRNRLREEKEKLKEIKAEMEKGKMATIVQ